MDATVVLEDEKTSIFYKFILDSSQEEVIGKYLFKESKTKQKREIEKQNVVYVFDIVIFGSVSLFSSHSHSER
jgi:hypothetical protein